MAKKLLDQMQDALRLKHYSYRTEETYLNWARRYILFHRKRHPGEMGAPEIQAFLLHYSTTLNIKGESYRLKEKRKAGLLGRPNLKEEMEVPTA